MKIKYVSDSSARNLKEEDIRIVATELRVIQKEESTIRPESVVARAANPKSPLHKFFEWNNTKAAELYRNTQARRLIACVYIVDADEPDAQPIRAFVNVSPDSEDDVENSRGYVFTPGIINRQNYTDQVLEYAKSQLIGWRKRFGNYKEFLGVFKEIDKIK